MVTTPHAIQPALANVQHATHIQRQVAIIAVMDALIGLGFHGTAAINGGDAVDDVAQAFDRIRDHVLVPGAQARLSERGQHTDVARQR